MANIKSQIKRNKTNELAREANKSFKSETRTAIKKANLAMESKSENANFLLNEAISLIDKAVTKGIYHNNKAARIKSRLMTK